ncbi:MAG: hypothetical protein HYT75_07450 [Deltaproteobacteria bacterium]|nr:hypothetical protein [Deltaproteobacteria bacterium]
MSQTIDTIVTIPPAPATPDAASATTPTYFNVDTGSSGIRTVEFSGGALNEVPSGIPLQGIDLNALPTVKSDGTNVIELTGADGKLHSFDPNFDDGKLKFEPVSDIDIVKYEADKLGGLGEIGELGQLGEFDKRLQARGIDINTPRVQGILKNLERSENIANSQWSRERDKIQLGMQIGRDLAGLGTIIAQGILAFKQLNLQSRMLDIAEAKEINAQVIKETMLEKEYAYKDRVLDVQKDIEKTRASTEVAKAKISAKTKETKIKSDAMASLFFARRQYSLGSPAYAG